MKASPELRTEIALVFDKAPSADQLLDVVDFPRTDRPAFSTASEFWNEVFRQIEYGKLADGVEKIRCVAANAYPSNAVFKPATQDVVAVKATDSLGRPVPDLQIRAEGGGSIAATDDDGKATVALAAQVQAGALVTLALGPQDLAPEDQWVFKSPENGLAEVPSFAPGNCVNVVLIRRREVAEVAAIVEKLVASRTAEFVSRETAYQEQIQAHQEQNKALTDAVQSLAIRRGEPDAPHGMEQALKELENGKTDAAETIFSEVLERKASEAEAATQQAAAATQEAAAAARHLGALVFLHDTDGALGYYRRAVELEPESPVGWNQLGHLLLRIGELEEAETACTKVQELGESGSGREWVAIAYGHLGLIYQTRGDLEGAEELHRKSLAIEEELGRKEGMAIAYGNLGNIYQTRGDLEGAEELLRKSLAINEELGRKEGMASTYGNLGLIYQTRGDLEQARVHWHKARQLFVEVGARPHVELVEGWLASLGDGEP